MQIRSFVAPIPVSVRSLRSLFVALPLAALVCAAPLSARAGDVPTMPHIYLFDTTLGLVDVTPTFDGVSVLDANGSVVLVNVLSNDDFNSAGGHTTDFNSAGGHTTDFNSAGGHTTDFNSAGGHTTDFNSAGGHTTDFNSAGGHTTDFVVDDTNTLIGIVVN